MLKAAEKVEAAKKNGNIAFVKQAKSECEQAALY
jgi:hypothetical protein